MMKAIKYQHPFFPTGKGLLILAEKELVLIYRSGEGFTILYTDYPASLTYKEDAMKCIKEPQPQTLDFTGTLTEVLNGLNDEILAEIYSEVVGYDPFQDDPANARALVLDYFTLPESIDEIF